MPIGGADCGAPGPRRADPPTASPRTAGERPARGWLTRAARRPPAWWASAIRPPAGARPGTRRRRRARARCRSAASGRRSDRRKRGWAVLYPVRGPDEAGREAETREDAPSGSEWWGSTPRAVASILAGATLPARGLSAGFPPTSRGPAGRGRSLPRRASGRCCLRPRR